jgi:ABC-type phosphonate transport system ATPase subunit
MSALVSNAVLEAQQLTKRYGALVACDQVSLSLLPGEIQVYADSFAVRLGCRR